jgi:hypothetical protein
MNKKDKMNASENADETFKPVILLFKLYKTLME